MIENDEAAGPAKREPALVAIVGSPLMVGRHVLARMAGRVAGAEIFPGCDETRRFGPPSRKLTAEEIGRFFPGIAAKA